MPQPVIKKIKVWKPEAILIAMFGVMAPDRWREEVGLPFVEANIGEFFQRKKRDGRVMMQIQRLRAIARANADVEDNVPEIEEDTASPEDVFASVITFLNWQSSRGRSNNPTRAIRNMVMTDGVERGQLKVEIYEDVLPALTAWKEQGIKIFVDCPHLTSDEGKLYLKHTSAGDMSRLVENVFGKEGDFVTPDTKQSYRNMLNATGISMPDLLYVTHIGQIAKDMADEFKVPVLLVDRNNDNRKIRKYYLIRFRCVYKLTQTLFVKRSSQPTKTKSITRSKSQTRDKSPTHGSPTQTKSPISIAAATRLLTQHLKKD